MATSCEMSSERDVELGRGGAREARKCWLSSLGKRSDRANHVRRDELTALDRVATVAIRDSVRIEQ